MNRELWIETRRTCLIYSSGGHYTELCRALEGIRLTDAFHVTFRSGRELEHEEIYFITHPRRSAWRTLLNAAESIRLLIRNQPELIISTGADVAVPTFILGRLMGAETIFIETCGTLTPSLAGRLVYRFSSLFIVQWREKQACFPKARLARGPLL